MENRDEIAAGFPEPRDDEPSSLRDDIVDELADHLQCAAGREWLERRRQGDEAGEGAVSSAVLERFGDPSAVARNLWFEGMKEKLMTQRLTIATLLLIFAVTMGMCLVTWRSMASLPARNAQLEQANAELLQELRSLMESKKADAGHQGAPAEWSHLEVKCVLDASDGPPANQARVQLTSDSDSTSRMPPFDEQTDEQGLIDFGQVLFGSYRLDVTAPCGATLSRQLSVHPGRSKQETIVCPSEATAPVDLNVVKKGLNKLPEELREKLWWKLSLYAQPTDGWTNGTVHCTIYITPQGQYAVLPSTNSQAANEVAILHQSQDDPFWHANDIFAYSYANPLELTDTVNLPIGHYTLSMSGICMQSSADESGRTFVETFRRQPSAPGIYPADVMQLVTATPNQPESVTIEVTADPDQVRRIHLVANMPEGMKCVSMYAEVPDGLESGELVDVSVRLPANDGGLAAPLRILSSVTLASVSPSRSTQPTFPETVLALSDEEAGILTLARFTGRLTVTRHASQGSDQPRIAGSPFRELNKRAQELYQPDDLQLMAVPVLADIADDEMSESTSTQAPTVGAYVRVTAKVPLGHSYNTIVMIPQGPRSWAEQESDPLLVQGVADTPDAFRPRYQVYLLQARKQDHPFPNGVRIHEARVERIASESTSSR